ncbi:uncharacterized protein LOC107367698 isoform X2 [Tetranychus urticae]|uniref:uncharacterized protein LOC107367698 isoform X2 n=1 Tax=Tetranychus urticae TaxID=32264 RepID=UPI000D64E803|nr:uncharacterized protein LOC107367698 isoform X2 [Tetranychus urticae]
MASTILYQIIFFITFICVNNCVNGDANGVNTNVSSTSPITIAGNLSSPVVQLSANDSKVDWIQSVLQAYEAGSKTTNGTNDLDTSASGHRYRVTHVNPSPSSYEEDDYRSRASSAYRGSSYHHHHHHRGNQPLSSYESNDNHDNDHRDYHSHPPKSRSSASRDDISPAPLSARDDASRKTDPDFGQHYDSDGHRYDFGYDVKDKDGAQAFRKESGDAKSLKGSYGIRDVDGRLRIVRYVADEKGFRAKVETNEPGTGSEDSANVYFNGYDAERIPSHEVVHKDRGQHSFKHGHYNKHTPADSGLYDDHREYVDEQSSDEVSGYRLHDQIPMEIQPAVGPRMRFATVPIDANMVDTVDPDGSVAVAAGLSGSMDGLLPRTPYKDVASPYHTSLHHHIHHHPSSPLDLGHAHKFSRPMYSKRRQDSKVTDFTYNIPYNSITGFFKTRYL